MLDVSHSHFTHPRGAGSEVFGHSLLLFTGQNQGAGWEVERPGQELVPWHLEVEDSKSSHRIGSSPSLFIATNVVFSSQLTYVGHFIKMELCVLFSIILWFIHTVGYCQYCLYFNDKIKLHWMDMDLASPFITWWTCFHFLAVINNAAVNTCVQMVLFCCFLEFEIAGSHDNPEFNFFEELPNCFA